jgi:hypothetical protein
MSDLLVAGAVPDPADATDFADAARGFIASLPEPVIRTANGTPVWDLNVAQQCSFASTGCARERRGHIGERSRHTGSVGPRRDGPGRGADARCVDGHRGYGGGGAVLRDVRCVSADVRCRWLKIPAKLTSTPPGSAVDIQRTAEDFRRTGNDQSLASPGISRREFLPPSLRTFPLCKSNHIRLSA